MPQVRRNTPTAGREALIWLRITAVKTLKRMRKRTKPHLLRIDRADCHH